MAVRPPKVSRAGNHAWAVAWLWPPLGSAMTRNTARPTDVTEADTQAAATTSRRNHIRARTSENTNSVTRIDWTSDMAPL